MSALFGSRTLLESRYHYPNSQSVTFVYKARSLLTGTWPWRCICLYPWARCCYGQAAGSKTDTIPQTKGGTRFTAEQFSEIVSKEIPAVIVHEDEKCVAFHALDPQMPVHLLVVPRKPIEALSLCNEEDVELLGHLLLTAKQLAEKENLEEGFQIVLNDGHIGNKPADQLHINLLGRYRPPDR